MQPSRLSYFTEGRGAHNLITPEILQPRHHDRPTVVPRHQGAFPDSGVRFFPDSGFRYQRAFPDSGCSGTRGLSLIQGFGFRVPGVRFRDWGLVFGVWGLGFRVYALGFRV